LGGEGAPLVPMFHLYQFAQQHRAKAILNLGGIANVSLLVNDTLSLGFDTGPANTLLDAWCYRHTQQRYDHNGNWAASGNLLPSLLEKMLADPYFSLPAPKSTGREHFNLSWLESLLHGNEAPEAVQHTLAHLTVQSVANALKEQPLDELIVCGGGAHNKFILNLFSKTFSTRIQIGTTAEYGLPPEQVEAAAFAWLAWAHIHKIVGNAPQTTVASKGLILGGLYRG